MKVACLIVGSFAAVAAFGDGTDDPYADYVRLDRRDTYNTPSWNAVGGWSDGAEPDSSKNYYVAPNAILWRKFTTDDADRPWKGGRLVLAGMFHPEVSQGDQYAPFIRDLVMLGGSEVRTETYGPFYTVNDEIGTVTVYGTADNPARITQHYYESFPSGSLYPRSHSLTAKFIGTEDSYLTYTRPFRNYKGQEIDHGFYCRLLPATFADYHGTFHVTGGNTIVTPDGNKGLYKWPHTALRISDGAECQFHVGNYNESATLRSLTASGAKLVFGYKTTKKDEAYPTLEVSDGFVIDGGTTVKINAPLASFVSGVSDDNPQGLSMKVAHLGKNAAETVGDLSDAKLIATGNIELPSSTFKLLAVDDGADGKNVYVATPGIVAMTNNNVESTGYPAGAIQYGAFEAGHEGDWSNGVTPPADSSLHYWCSQRICFFKPTELPNATLTMAYSSSWKGGGLIRFKEINMLEGIWFGLWADTVDRVMSAERFRIVGTDADKLATINVASVHTLTIDANLCSDGPGFKIGSFNSTKGTAAVSLNRANVDFHGRLTIYQESTTGAKYIFKTYLGDALNWGGTYTASDDGFDAIKLDNFPQVIVTNSVNFVEPTRGLHVLGGAKLEVQDGYSMRLANQVTYAGLIEKTGAGTLDLAGSARFIDGAEGTLPLEGTNRIDVLEGALRVSSASAADGLAISFVDGTRLIVPSDTEYGYRNLKWDAPLAVNTSDGVLPVVIDMVTDVEGVSELQVPFCTVSATAASSMPVTMFRVMRTANGFCCKSVVKRSNEDGSVSYVATIGRTAMQVIIR